MNIHERLRRDFPEHHDLIDARAAHGLAEHEGRPFASAIKDDWIPDVQEELGDALFYLEAQIEKEANRKRYSAHAFDRWLELREVRRRVAECITKLREIANPGRLES